MKRLAVVTVLMVLVGCTTLSAQVAIDASRRITWSTAGAGTIPTRTTICSTLSPGASAAVINTAIAACPAGQVVFLNAGTYTIGGLVIARSNVTLRGAGPLQTFLVFTGYDGCVGLPANVCVKNTSGGPTSDNPGTVANWTAGYAKGTTSLTFSTVSGLSVGMMLVLDQLDDTDTDTGEVWVCQTLACSSEAGSGGRTGRAQMQFVRVTGISGSTVTISPGLYMPNWRSGRSPQAWWITPGEGVGIENLTMNHAGSGTGAMTGQFWVNMRDSWVRNIRSLSPNRNHVWLYEDAHITIRDSYFYGTLNSASVSYGIETRMGSDHLIENNIFQHMPTGMMNGNTNGTVWGYNYSIDDFYTVAAWQQASSYFHDAGVDYVLFEGNDGIGVTGDNIHGTAHFGTSFRNYWTGRDTTSKFAQTSAVIFMATQRFHNLLGNVFGTSGYHTNYECYPAATSTASCSQNANLSIFSLGWSGNEGSKYGALPNDLLVRSTSFRWGNFDTVTNGTRFVPGEVPTGLSLYAQPLPGTTVLPSSLYLGAAPTFFRSITWPPIGPDITTGSLVSGHVVKIPARQCYESTTQTNGLLNFDANLCYSGTRQIINTGAFLDDTSAQSTLSAFAAVSAMMTELYARILPASSPLTLGAGETIRAKFIKINTMASQLAAAAGVTVPTINVGAAVDDPAAETIRSAFTKVNTITGILYAVP